jgi:hypothetical protein
MKFFTFRSTTEEQKTAKAILFRLYAVFLLFSVGMLGTFAIYLQIVGEKRSAYSHWQFMFFLMIIGHVISMAPNIMKYSWKQIIIISSATGAVLGIFLAATLRFL